MPTTMTPMRLSPGRITGPRRWRRRTFTSRPTAGSKPRFANGWNIGTSGAKSGNRPTPKRVDPRLTEGASAHVPGRPGCLLAGADDLLGAQDPHRHPHPRRDVDRRPGGQMGAPTGDRPHAGAQETYDRLA